MAVLKISTFGGIAPKVPARYLQDSQAQVAINCPVFNGSLQPLPDNSSAIYTLTKTGTPQTMYRFGQDTQSDTSYWFHWTQDVDVCRGQIAGDASEWTFFSGDGGPKATYNAIALATGNYPTVARPLGIPAPTAASTAALNSFNPDSHAAEVMLTAQHIKQLSTTYGLLISTTTDDEAEYTTVNLTLDPPTAQHVADRVNAVFTDVLAEVSSGSVLLKTTALGLDAKLFVKFQTGEEADLGSDPTDLSTPNLTSSGAANTRALVVLTDTEIGSIASGDKIKIVTNSGTVIASVAVTSTHTAATFASWITNRVSGKIVAIAYGSCVVLKPGTQGTGASGTITYNRIVGTDTVSTYAGAGSETAAPAQVFVTQADIDAIEGKHLKLVVNNGEPTYIPVPATSYVANLTGLNPYGVTVTTFGSVSPFAIVKTNATGTSTALTFRGTQYPTKAIYSLQTGEGYVDEDETTETRVYTWTWVNKESGYEFESAPAPASNTVDVRAGQTVSISGLQEVPTGEYVVTNRRVYRAVNGTYLFVKEIPAANASFTDDVKPENLGEELPTLMWAAPPQELRGLKNLPNGLMAGFVGRDVYFCEPYHPHAWPESYVQSLDYPVVGFGRMDTTLAVLTTGCPYLIQGTHPAAMAVVKSDLEQACVSKRSIVSHGGAVFYAAPDGLMMLAPGGSQIVTQQLFSYKQWQAFFKPESIHAYQHDNQYIAFYDTGEAQGGFIFDMVSKQFILHDIYATAGFNDLQRDKLFLAFADRSVKVWGQGTAKSYVWRSKRYTMPKPLSFGWAQLEAEDYPMTLKIIVDDALIHTQTVTSRNAFRLPATVGRDWELQVEGSYEAFSLALAHSASELRDG